MKYQDEFDGPIEEESFEYDYEDFLQSQMPPSFNEIFQHCLLPTIESVKGHVGKLIICCIIFRISTQLCKFFHPFFEILDFGWRRFSYSPELRILLFKVLCLLIHKMLQLSMIIQCNGKKFFREEHLFCCLQVFTSFLDS